MLLRDSDYTKSSWFLLSTINKKQVPHWSLYYSYEYNSIYHIQITSNMTYHTEKGYNAESLNMRYIIFFTLCLYFCFDCYKLYIICDNNITDSSNYCYYYNILLLLYKTTIDVYSNRIPVFLFYIYIWTADIKKTSYFDVVEEVDSKIHSGKL